MANDRNALSTDNKGVRPDHETMMRMLTIIISGAFAKSQGAPGWDEGAARDATRLILRWAPVTDMPVIPITVSAKQSTWSDLTKHATAAGLESIAATAVTLMVDGMPGVSHRCSQLARAFRASIAPTDDCAAEAPDAADYAAKLWPETDIILGRGIYARMLRKILAATGGKGPRL